MCARVMFHVRVPVCKCLPPSVALKMPVHLVVCRKPWSRWQHCCNIAHYTVLQLPVQPAGYAVRRVVAARQEPWQKSLEATAKTCQAGIQLRPAVQFAAAIAVSQPWLSRRREGEAPAQVPRSSAQCPPTVSGRRALDPVLSSATAGSMLPSTSTSCRLKSTPPWWWDQPSSSPRLVAEGRTCHIYRMSARSKPQSLLAARPNTCA